MLTVDIECDGVASGCNGGGHKYMYFITRNEVTFLYVLLECFKWISTYFKANNAINPCNIDSL